MADKMELYKAVKWEVEHFAEDHGMTLPQLWKVVSYAYHYVGASDWCKWWKQQVLADYRERRVW